VQPKDFNKHQKQIIIKAFKYGSKNGFGYTMAAIAWKESCAGEYRINFADPSAGIYHAHIPGIIKTYNKGFSWEKDKEREKMANAYFEDIANRIKTLQNYIPKITSGTQKIAKNDYAITFLNERLLK